MKKLLLFIDPLRKNALLPVIDDVPANDVPANDSDEVGIAFLDERKRFDADEIAWILMLNERVGFLEVLENAFCKIQIIIKL